MELLNQVRIESLNLYTNMHFFYKKHLCILSTFKGIIQRFDLLENKLRDFIELSTQVNCFEVDDSETFMFVQPKHQQLFVINLENGSIEEKFKSEIQNCRSLLYLPKKCILLCSGNDHIEVWRINKQLLSESKKIAYFRTYHDKPCGRILNACVDEKHFVTTTGTSYKCWNIETMAEDYYLDQFFERKYLFFFKKLDFFVPTLFFPKEKKIFVMKNFFLHILNYETGEIYPIGTINSFDNIFNQDKSVFYYFDSNHFFTRYYRQQRRNEILGGPHYVNKTFIRNDIAVFLKEGIEIQIWKLNHCEDII